MKKLVLLIPHFGKPVPWLPFFLVSCARNPLVDWYIISDYPLGDRPDNVKHIETSFPDYQSLASKKLGVKLAWPEAYKLCDMKPMLGLIHQDIVAKYPFWGYGDIDLVYGNLLAVYAPLMQKHDVISSVNFLLAGHLSVFRTLPETLSLFSDVKGWRSALQTPKYVSFDEGMMTKTLLPPGVDMDRLRYAQGITFHREFKGCRLSVLFKEQFTTFNEPQLLPDGRLALVSCWRWQEGELRCDVLDGNIAYAHFSAWHSGRYGKNNPDLGVWKRNQNTSFPDVHYRAINDFNVTRSGISLLA